MPCEQFLNSFILLFYEGGGGRWETGKEPQTVISLIDIIPSLPPPRMIINFMVNYGILQDYKITSLWEQIRLGGIISSIVNFHNNWAI